MKIPLVCRSCGIEQKVDLSQVGAKVICAFCEHEASTGDAGQRKSIETQQAKSRLFLRVAGAAGLVGALLVATLVATEGAAGLGAALWAGAGVCFLAFVSFLTLGEREREVVYF